MPKRYFFLLVLLGSALLFPGLVPSLQARQPLIQEGDLFPDISLKTPSGARDRAYLGIPPKNTFTVKDIKAKVILVEIMNVYCASCQNQAPIYNKLFNLIQANPKTRNQIKIIGVSAGNNDQEIKIFRDQFQVPFPIVPDPQYVMHAAIGGTPTPFSIFVRRDSKDKSVLVAATHLGYDKDYDKLFKQISSLMNRNLADISKKRNRSQPKVLTLKPPFSEEEIEAKIKAAFTKTGGQLTGFGKVGISSEREIYVGMVEKDGQAETHLFAEVISEFPTCDVCHDIFFIYTFEPSGKIIDFIPLQLSKYGNVPWNEADILKMRQKIVGRFIYNPFIFDNKVDAVTSATITSAAIFKGLNKGQVLFEELKQKGLI